MLKFGTGGIRAIMQPGVGFMNIDTIHRATAGLGKYLLSVSKKPKVVVSFDSRNNSELFATETAKVLSSMGVQADKFNEMQPVPVLSYTVRSQKYDAGVMITASHNSREYNGYKVYGPNGGQVVDEVAAAIEKYINELTDKEIEEIASKSGNAKIGSTEPIGYSDAMESCSNFAPERDIDVIYTPLHGSGLKHAVEMLEYNHFRYVVVKEQMKPDGNFPTCPRPNPEVDSVYDIAKTYPGEIIIATDPDADRCGVYLPKENRILTGNEIGTLITYYLKQELKLPGTIVCSYVSTPIIEKIAEKVIRTPVGFKWIGDQMDELGSEFLFGFEESCGYLVGNYARDKDGMLGCKLICQMAAHYKAQGKTITGVLEEIYAKYGKVVGKQFTKELSPNDPKPESVVKEFPDGAKIIVRPSGTEPKVKYYTFAENFKRCEEIYLLTNNG